MPRANTEVPEKDRSLVFLRVSARLSGRQVSPC